MNACQPILTYYNQNDRCLVLGKKTVGAFTAHSHIHSMKASPFWKMLEKTFLHVWESGGVGKRHFYYHFSAEQDGGFSF